MQRYACAICKLEFGTADLARRCEEWCAEHDSCNWEIGRQASNREALSGCTATPPVTD